MATTKHPLYRLLYRQVYRIATDTNRDRRLHPGATVEAWRESVRALLARQIMRRSRLGGEMAESTHGFVAACEGHNYWQADSAAAYVAMTVQDTVEQIELLGKANDAATATPQRNKRADPAALSTLRRA